MVYCGTGHLNKSNSWYEESGKVAQAGLPFGQWGRSAVHELQYNHCRFFSWACKNLTASRIARFLIFSYAFCHVYSTQLAKMSFDEILDLTADVFFLTRYFVHGRYCFLFRHDNLSCRLFCGVSYTEPDSSWERRYFICNFTSALYVYTCGRDPRLAQRGRK